MYAKLDQSFLIKYFISLYIDNMITDNILKPLCDNLKYVPKLLSLMIDGIIFVLKTIRK